MAGVDDSDERKANIGSPNPVHWQRESKPASAAAGIERDVRVAEFSERMRIQGCDDRRRISCLRSQAAWVELKLIHRMQPSELVGQRQLCGGFNLYSRIQVVETEAQLSNLRERLLAHGVRFGARASVGKW